jgi:hypothetical protein
MPIVGGSITIAPLEVYHKDHRNQNGKWKIANDLLRYTIVDPLIGLTPGSPLIEVWNPNTSAWVSVGNYQLQNVNAGVVLPVQTAQFLVISPEEMIWVERRYDAAGTALAVVTNRIRRGSRIIESQIVAASGAGLTGTQSVAIANVTGTLAVAQSADSTGVVFTGAGADAKQLPGFCYLTQNPNAPTISGTLCASGATVPAGTVTRIGILVGYQDAQYTSLGATGGLYAARWASYGRIRIRQKIVVGISA